MHFTYAAGFLRDFYPHTCSMWGHPSDVMCGACKS